MMKAAFLIILMFTLQLWSDTVTLNNGDEIYGKITAIGKESVKISDLKGKDHDFAKKDLLKVSFLGFKKLEGENTPAEIKSKELRDLLKEDLSEAKYPDAGHINLIDEARVSLSKDGSATERDHIAAKILKERSRDLSNVRFYYKKGEETQNIDFARTILDKDLFYLNEESIQDESVFYQLKAYEKTHCVKFAVPRAAIGSVIEYGFTKKTLKTDILHPFFGEFYFREQDPKKICRLVVEVPKGSNFVFEIGNNQENKVKLKKEISADKETYTFSADNLPGYISEDEMPPYKMVFPYVTYGIDYGFDKLAKEIQARLEENLGKSDEVGKKVDEICGKLKDDKEKAVAIFDYVVREIPQQPVSMQHYSYLPKPVSEIFQNRFANRLDMAFIYYAMLKRAGIDCDFCYGISKVDGKINGKLGNIGQFDFNCVYLKKEDKYVAPLSDSMAFDELYDSYQDSDVFDVNTGKFGKTPLLKPEAEGYADRVKISLSGDYALSASESCEFFGARAMDIRSKKAMNKAELDKEVERQVSGIHPNARVKNYKYENLQELSRKPAFSCEYQIGNYALHAGKFMVFRLPGLDYSASSVGKTDREYPFYWNSCERDAQEFEIKLPEGYKIYYMPEPINAKAGPVAYKASFTEKGGVIVFSDEMVKNGELLDVKDYKDYKSLMEKRAKLGQEYIVIEKQ